MLWFVSFSSVLWLLRTAWHFICNWFLSTKPRYVAFFLLALGYTILSWYCGSCRPAEHLFIADSARNFWTATSVVVTVKVDTASLWNLTIMIQIPTDGPLNVPSRPNELYIWLSCSAVWRGDLYNLICFGRHEIPCPMLSLVSVSPPPQGSPPAQPNVGFADAQQAERMIRLIKYEWLYPAIFASFWFITPHSFSNMRNIFTYLHTIFRG